MHEHDDVVLQAINPAFGQLGHFFVIIAFVAAVVATIGYFFAAKNERDPAASGAWHKLGRGAFYTHAAAIVGIVITLFFMIFNHHFEYQYVWQHSSMDLPVKYILSCFWEGQEGSFLLWSFWIMVLGVFLTFKAKSWEKPVMTFIALQQVFLVSFLLGVYILGRKVGSTPFLLLEDALTQDPVFLFNDYMQFIQDGTGLNALLQNYWMVIHPPVLFLGFASITIPFTYAMAALWTRKYESWISPALPYALFAAMVLGTGILMGGAWAYEALSFGGFWAWDPVENASLIPWLVMVAALHTMVVSKATGHSLRTNFVLVPLAFFFVLYASFLTRSGILGDTSVHSFVVSGLENHLLLFLGVFTAIGLVLIIRNWKSIPNVKKEEATSSREFWMFIGSLVLVFSALHVIFFTSIPAFNELFKGLNRLLGTSIKSDFTAPVDAVGYYTGVQIWVGVLIAGLTAIGQFLRYKKSDAKKFWSALLYPFLLAVALTAWSAGKLGYPLIGSANMMGLSFPFLHPNALLLLLGYFTVFTNAQYWILILKGKVKLAGGSIAHIGFGILLLGILISNANQMVISKNTTGINYGDDFDQDFKRDNILLYKNAPMVMGDYLVTYLGDSIDNRKTFFKVQYEKVGNTTGEITQSFTLYPYLLLDKKSQQLTPNPDTKHYITHDVFTHVSSIPKKDAPQQDERTNQHTLAIGDSIWLSKSTLILNDIRRIVSNDTIGAMAVFIETDGSKSEVVQPRFEVVGNELRSVEVPLQIGEGGVTFTTILTEEDKFVFSTREANIESDWIIMKAIVFPMINLVWLGTIILAIGFAISMRKRILETRRKAA